MEISGFEVTMPSTLNEIGFDFELDLRDNFLNTLPNFADIFWVLVKVISKVFSLVFPTKCHNIITKTLEGWKIKIPGFFRLTM